MSKITYRVSGSRVGARFEFQVHLNDGFATSRLVGTTGVWRAAEVKNLPLFSAGLETGGEWKFRAASDGQGFLFLGSKQGFGADLVFDDVPQDYIHGPFCSTAAGKGVFWASTQEKLEIKWEVQGPGCT